MEQNKHPVIMTLCFILALALILGGVTVSVYGFDEVKNTVVSWFSGDDADEDPPSDTTKPDNAGSANTDGSTDNTGGSSFYIDSESNLGYRTVGNSTVFFLKVSRPNLNLTDDRYGPRWSAWIEPSKCVGYQNIPMDIRLSFNSGITWCELKSDFEQDHSILSTGLMSGDIDEIFISYVFIDDCASPQFIFEELRSTIFDVKYKDTYFGGDYYEDFHVHTSNEWIAPSGTPVG